MTTDQALSGISQQLRRIADSLEAVIPISTDRKDVEERKTNVETTPEPPIPNERPPYLGLHRATPPSGTVVKADAMLRAEQYRIAERITMLQDWNDGAFAFLRRAYHEYLGMSYIDPGKVMDLPYTAVERLMDLQGVYDG